MQYDWVSSEIFEDALQSWSNNNPRYKPFVTLDTDFSEYDCYLSLDELSGFAITPENEIVAVFNDSEQRRGSELLFMALKEGGRWLNCYDGYLTTLYRCYGFQVSGRMSWNDAYAPDGWDYSEFGKPDVVFMSYNPGIDVEEESFTSEEWEEAAGRAREATMTV